MSKSYRSLLWTGAILATVAACGDDVTVVAPPGGGINSVTVAPDQATIPVQGTVQMIAAVNADSGVATTVTWASSNPQVASISATGLVTGVSAGTVGITACSTVNTSACGAATVTVAAPVPATISIQSVTAGGLGTPVNINNVFGQIDVSLNFEPGSTPATSVELLIDGVVVASQGFSALEWAALVSKAVEEGGELAKVVIVLSVNTADFNATTGVPKYFNGPRQLSARANLQGGAQVATPSQTLIFNNANIVNITASVANGSSANSGTGILWQTGDLVATAIPVIYTAPNPTIQQVVLNVAGLASKVVTAAPFTATWAKGTTIANGGAGSRSAGIETFGLVVTANSTVNGGVGPNGVSNAINFDTQAPGAPTFVANPNNRQNGWINGTVGLVGLNTGATDNDWMLNGAADAGVGGYVRMLRVGASAAGGTVAAANAATSSATPALPAPALANVSYCGVATAADLLGNESSTPANATLCNPPPFGSFVATGLSHQQFGVDIAAPTIAFSGGLAANARINAATLGAEFQVTVADTGTVGNSGMLSGAAVIGNIMARNAAGTTCFFGAGAACAQQSVNAAPPFPLVPTTVAAAAPAPAYYTYVAKAQDAAGNQTADVTRVVVADNVAATASAPAVPVTITGSFSAAAFLNDDLSIRDYYWTVTFGGLGNVTLDASPTVVDAFNSATLTNTNVGINKTVNTYLGLQSAPPAAYVPNAFPLNSLNLFVRDQTQPAYTGPVSAAIAPTAPATGVPTANFTSYVDATSAATICAGQAGAPACGATPAGATWRAVATGTTAVFNNPFSRVDFYAQHQVTGDFVLIGSVPAASATTVDNGATRVHTYSLAVTALDLYSRLGGVVPAVLGPVTFFGAGVNAAGNVAMINGGAGQTINP